MIKAGASNTDKNYIRYLHKEGHTVDQIAALSHVRIEHVEAIVAQLETTGETGYVGAQMASEQLDLEDKE